MGKALVITAGGGTDTEDGNPNINPEVILSGFTAYGFDGEIIEGNMPFRTLYTSMNAGESTDVPAGFYDGSESNTVTANPLSGQTSATAGAAQVLKDYTGWKDGSKITGTMINRGAISESLSANGTYIVPAGWHNGSGKVTQSLTTQAAKTITPGTTQQTIVNSSIWVTGNQVVAGNGNLVAGNIKKDINIFGVVGTFQVGYQEISVIANTPPTLNSSGDEYVGARFINTPRTWTNSTSGLKYYYCYTNGQAKPRDGLPFFYLCYNAYKWNYLKLTVNDRQSGYTVHSSADSTETRRLISMVIRLTNPNTTNYSALPTSITRQHDAYTTYSSTTNHDNRVVFESQYVWVNPGSHFDAYLPSWNGYLGMWFYHWNNSTYWTIGGQIDVLMINLATRIP